MTPQFGAAGTSSARQVGELNAEPPEEEQPPPPFEALENRAAPGLGEDEVGASRSTSTTPYDLEREERRQQEARSRLQELMQTTIPGCIRLAAAAATDGLIGDEQKQNSAKYFEDSLAIVRRFHEEFADHLHPEADPRSKTIRELLDREEQTVRDGVVEFIRVWTDHIVEWRRRVREAKMHASVVQPAAG
eukprot:GSA120T00019629001.1